MNKLNEIIILGGGCFWCLEAVFKKIQGVISVESGYSGGQRSNPSYEYICTSVSGYVEVVKITFNPQTLSLKHILDIFFNIHDPTTIDRQGNDIGSQYSSVIFYQNLMQKQTAQETINLLNGQFSKPIVTRVEALKNYYPAEAYHQNYYEKNPNQSYCQYVVRPKLEKALKQFSNYVVS